MSYCDDNDYGLFCPEVGEFGYNTIGEVVIVVYKRNVKGPDDTIVVQRDLLLQNGKIQSVTFKPRLFKTKKDALNYKTSVL